MNDYTQQLAGFADVSRETVDRLIAFDQLIRKWNPTINLISKASIDDLWSRHIEDSAQLYQHIPLDAVRCVDIGSGGGLPGIVLAAISADLAPERRFTLVESDQRKATFLRQAVRTLDLNVEVLSSRTEALAPLGADVLSARALAPLVKLLISAQRHLASGGTCLFPKGETYAKEIADARKQFVFECDAVQSRTDPKGAILKIHGIRNA